MGSKLTDMPEGAGGWFKPEEHKDTAVLLIEVTGYQAQRPTDFGPRDSIITTMTVFKTAEDLNTGIPSDVLKNHRVEQSILCRDLRDNVGVGGATAVVLAQAASSKPGQRPAWVWRKPSEDAKARVAAYLDQRDAAVEAAIAAAPGFDD